MVLWGEEGKWGLTVEVGLAETEDKVAEAVVGGGEVAPSEEEPVLLWSVDVLLGVGGLVTVMVVVKLVVVGRSDLPPENLFMAPRMASRVPVMPTVQRMMPIHCHRESSLYQGSSGGSTQISSCRTGSLLLPAVSRRREERRSRLMAVSWMPSALWAMLAPLAPWETTSSGKGLGRVSEYW